MQLYEKNDFHFLEVHDVSQEDKGEVTCKVTNSQGTVTHTVELEVYSEFALLSLRVKTV